MKKFHCRCGQRVYFDNLSCMNCSRQLAFDFADLTMQAETDAGAGLNFCVRRASASRCNWLADPAAGDGMCRSCRMTQIIPALSKRANRLRWRQLEVAKRRLFYDLLRLGLPLDPSRLSFEFKEDRRTNPDVGDAYVAIGHADGVITINAAEADKVFRETQRQALAEPMRTLLGHFRHESGHFYFNVLIDDGNRAEARRLFGDESLDYNAALERHYQNGPPVGWEARYVSAYAASHPLEDWAESWAHYLHIQAVLEVAVENGLIGASRAANWDSDFIDLVLVINEFMRSLGHEDAYPFVLTSPVIAKIGFIDRTVRN